MSSADVADPEVLEVAWDLDLLLDGYGSEPVAAIDAMLAEAQQRADAFAERHAGRVAELDGPGLVEAMTELGGLQDLVTRAGTFAGLHFSTDTADPGARRALPADPGARDADRDEAPVLRARVGRARRRARR